MFLIDRCCGLSLRTGCIIIAVIYTIVYGIRVTKPVRSNTYHHDYLDSYAYHRDRVEDSYHLVLDVITLMSSILLFFGSVKQLNGFIWPTVICLPTVYLIRLSLGLHSRYYWNSSRYRIPESWVSIITIIEILCFACVYSYHKSLHQKRTTVINVIA